MPGSVGMWLSLVEHLVRDQGVAGSNPVIPTMKTTGYGFPVRNLFPFPARLRRFFPRPPIRPFEARNRSALPPHLKWEDQDDTKVRRYCFLWSAGVSSTAKEAVRRREDLEGLRFVQIVLGHPFPSTGPRHVIRQNKNAHGGPS